MWVLISTPIHKAGDIMLEKIENAVIHKYGYEHKITIIIFWITQFFKNNT